MAHVNSPLGTIKQKIGNLRFSTWKGKNVIAQQPTQYTDANTTVQRGNRSIFKLLSVICSMAIVAVRIGFKNKAVGKTEANVFMGLNKIQFPSNTNMDATQLAKIKFSTGSLLGLAGATKTVTGATGKVDLTYTSNANGVNAMATDQVVIIAYDPVKNLGGSLVTAGTRASASATATFPQLAGSIPANVIVWAFFKSASSADNSPSQSI